MVYDYPEQIEVQNEEKMHQTLKQKREDKLEWSYMDKMRG